MIYQILIFAAIIIALSFFTIYMLKAHEAANDAEQQPQENKTTKNKPIENKIIESDWSKIQRFILKKLRNENYPKIKWKYFKMVINNFENESFQVSRPEKRRFWKTYCKLSHY